jgi:hypothetical protein
MFKCLFFKDIHGEVYFDCEFGGIAISDNMTKVAYIAEEKTRKTKPFLKASTTTNGDARKEDEQENNVGQEFRFKEEYGEQVQLTSKFQV